jgi:hypothetical protein
MAYHARSQGAKRVIVLTRYPSGQQIRKMALADLAIGHAVVYAELGLIQTDNDLWRKEQ